MNEADVIIIGCGPGGASAACYLRQAGHSVIVLEKEKFPRFHIGESLLPYNQGLFKELGLTPAIEAANFPKKFGAQFHLMDGSKCTRFVFRNGRFTAFHEAIQVERAKFDHILMKRAQQVGADVREEWMVRKFSENPDGVEVEASDPQGGSHTLRGKFLIDASGRNNVTGNQEKLREIHENHRKFAVFSHFTNVKLDADNEKRGDTIIVRLQNRWFWVIPVATDKTSVGLVIDRDDLEREGNDPAKSFWAAVNSSPVMRERLEGAKPIDEIKTIADFSYHNRRLSGSRLLRVGDAAGFMDPIFSAGVYLAMWSGKIAAQTVSKSIMQGNTSALRAYDKRVMKAMRVYWRLVENFYTTHFVELFMQPKPPLDLPAAVVAVLGGELEGGFHIKWRLEVFYFLVWLQKRFPLVPRLSLDSMGEPKHAMAH
ncbi:MAG TPA: NAD(P)/FAD-dependent oxidoreductase [Verrucomicrobiae bacterium]|nr:NAD(P)/FAD-dependent oxidoreductase [Verrucomicrobiae bacterium]